MVEESMTAGEFLQWFIDHPHWPAPSEMTIREMEAEGITFGIVNGAPYINSETWYG